MCLSSRPVRSSTPSLGSTATVARACPRRAKCSHCRAGEFGRYPDLLRGSRVRFSGRAGARVRAERALVGKAAGEVTRYLAVHGTGRVSAAVLVAPLLPSLLKTDDNAEGISRSVFHDIAARIAANRPAVMKDFMDRSYNVDLLGGSRVSDQAWQNSFYVAISASAPRRPQLRHSLPGRLPGRSRKNQNSHPGHPGRPGSRSATRPPARGFPRC